MLKVPSIEQKVKSDLALFENVKALSGVEPIQFDVIMRCCSSNLYVYDNYNDLKLICVRIGF